MTVKLEDLLYSSLSGLCNHEKGELLEDAVITLFVSLAKITSGHGLSDSEMIDLACMRFKCDDEIPKALPTRKLSEHHRKQLIPTSIALDILVAIILRDYTIELTPVQELD